MATQPNPTQPPIAMKTIHREAQLAREKTAPAPEPKMKGSLVLEAFTARELDAAEQLIHLSVSSGSSGTPRAPAGSDASYSSRSVGAPSARAPAPVPAGAVLLGGCVDWEEDEEQEVAGTQRRVKRYRLIAEIYAAREEIGGRTGRKKK